MSIVAFMVISQCTINDGTTITINTSNNGEFTHPFQGCTEINIYGTLNIGVDFDLTHLGPIVINIIGPNGKLAITSNNVDFTLAQNSSIVISNGGEIVQTNPCTNNRRIVVGSIAYAACTGGGNVDYTFTELTLAGGSIRGEIDASSLYVCEEDNFSLTIYSLGLNTMERQFILSKVTPSGDSTVVYDSGNIAAGDTINTTLDFSFADVETALEYVETGVYRFYFRAIDKNLNFFNDEILEINIIEFDECPSILPVELKEFKIRKENENIILNWITATEINNDGFEVQRSVDGINFTKIGWVEGRGNSSFDTYYQYRDVELLDINVVYYRLKQIDFDGQYEYSKIVSATFKTDKSKYVVYDLMGRKVDSIKSTGVYIKKYTDGTTEKFLVN